MGLRLALRQISSNILRATDGRDVLLNSPDGWEVEQPWLWYTGSSNGTPGPFGNPIPGASGSIAWAGIPAVARCTSLIVDTLAAMPWKVRRGTEQLPTPDWVADPQALRLDGRVVDASLAPARMSVMDWRAQWLTSALWFGDGFIFAPRRDFDGQPAPPLWVLHPHDVAIREGRYFVGDVELPAESIIHLRGLPPIHEGHGTGVFDRFAAELGYTQTIKNYAAGVFRSGVPAGYLKQIKEGLTQEKADELKAKWMEGAASGQRSIAVLNSVTEFHPLTFTPVDAALTEAMAANLGELANAFGVPPHMIGAPTDANTYANIESRRMDFVTFTLMPWSARIEATLDAQFPRGTSVKIALDSLLRADTASRYASYATGITGGWLTVEEVRALEDRPPLPTDEVAIA